MNLKSNLDELISNLIRSGIEFLHDEYYQEALDQFQKILKSNPTYDKAWSLLGLIHFKKKEYDKACNNYLKAYNLNESDSMNLFFLGHLFIKLDKIENAIKYLQKLVHSIPI